ncbi:MAG: enoyl-CoA hydratase/isomerase family protein [Rhodobacteraceae bacterium]|nr:enoyl-CoA hydratase/isomerase family protein [Paracoccaceae bacterium]
MQYETVLSVLDNGVRTITLNRPERLNAMNTTLIRETAEAFEAAHADPETRAIVFTGAGRAFCAGDDRQDHVEPANEAEARGLTEAIQAVTRAIMFGDRPVVGAINGWAVGGGFEWAINCDFPIWADSAKGFFPEVSLNFFVTGGVTSLLPALVGLNKARELLFLGERHSAHDLADMGLAWRVVPDDLLMAEANAAARRLADLPVRSVRAMKRVLTATAASDLATALDLETEATVAGFMDPLTTELVRDF